MTIYKPSRKSTGIYRRLYEKHHGPIPKEPNGRSYEIHHIDGDHSNNDISNLHCVTAQEHYDIHYEQGEFSACFLIAKRLELSPQEKSEIASKAAKERIRNGTHNFLDKEVRSANARKANATKVASGNHLFQTEGHKQRLKEILRVKLKDHTIYTFEHCLTKERVSMAQQDFVRKYSLNQGNVSSMIRNPNKSVKGWRRVG